MTNAKLQPLSSDVTHVISPDYAMMYAKLVRHITEMQGILLADENKTYPVEMLEELDNCVDEAMEFIKSVEKLIMHPMYSICTAKLKCKDNNEI